MAERYLAEGLDYILSVIPKGGAMGAITVGAFTSQTPTTVPAFTATFGNGGITEPAAGVGGYARVALLTADWGAPSTQGEGRRVNQIQKAFPETSAPWSPSSVNGGFLVVGATPGAGVLIYAANFDDGQAALMNAAGLVLRVTPFWQADG